MEIRQMKRAEKSRREQQRGSYAAETLGKNSGISPEAG
jgi:hypothetical protein